MYKLRYVGSQERKKEKEKNKKSTSEVGHTKNAMEVRHGKNKKVRAVEQWLSKRFKQVV